MQRLPTVGIKGKDRRPCHIAVIRAVTVISLDGPLFGVQQPLQTYV
jgi:hypothetical protein